MPQRRKRAEPAETGGLGENSTCMLHRQGTHGSASPPLTVRKRRFLLGVQGVVPRPASLMPVFIRPLLTAGCLNTHDRSDGAVRDVSIRQDVPYGILDGTRLICITNMADCGLYIAVFPDKTKAAS